MNSKDYVKIFRLDQENFQFNRKEFIHQLGEDFLEECKSINNNASDVNPNTNRIYYGRFRQIVKSYEEKFGEISQLSLKPLSFQLWKAFFATRIVPLRKSWYPELQKKIEEYRNIPSKQYKKSSRGNYDNKNH